MSYFTLDSILTVNFGKKRKIRRPIVEQRSLDIIMRWT